MKTITKISVAMLMFAWIGFLITSIHYMDIIKAPKDTLWLMIPIVLGLTSTVFTMMWIQDEDVWKSISDLKTERRFYNRQAYYKKVFIRALKNHILERDLPLDTIKKLAEDLEKEEYGENGYPID